MTNEAVRSERAIPETVAKGLAAAVGATLLFSGSSCSKAFETPDYVQAFRSDAGALPIGACLKGKEHDPATAEVTVVTNQGTYTKNEGTNDVVYLKPAGGKGETLALEAKNEFGEYVAIFPANTESFDYLVKTVGCDPAEMSSSSRDMDIRKEVGNSAVGACLKDTAYDPRQAQMTWTDQGTRVPNEGTSNRVYVLPTDIKSNTIALDVRFEGEQNKLRPIDDVTFDVLTQQLQCDPAAIS